jgi:hypothetical protein
MNFLKETKVLLKLIYQCHFNSELQLFFIEEPSRNS